MHKIRLVLLTLLLSVSSVANVFAMDSNFSKSDVVGLDLFNSLNPDVKNKFVQNISNIPDSIADWHKRCGGAIYFISGLIPDYTDVNVGKTLNSKIMSVIYFGNGYNNDIYIRIDPNLANNYQSNHYCRTISHELGHFVYRNTLIEWTNKMRDTLTNEYNKMKDIDYKCYTEEETFAHEYSKYKDSECLVTSEMANLFKDVERIADEEDSKLVKIEKLLKGNSNKNE